jgi:predicted metal-dependent enzyme (double-stranded beta helix superfamily)
METDITRRHIVTAATASALVALLHPKSLLAEATPKTSWEAFLAEARERGKALLAQGDAPVDEYLYLLASLASRLENVPPTDVQPVPWLKPPVLFGMASRGAPFVVIEWKFAPDAVLPPHNHPNASVCTIGLEGEAIVESYEITGNAPPYDSKKSFLVRRTHRQVIGPKRVSTVAPNRDNIHTFRAGGKGARGIDITSLHGKSEPFSYLKIEQSSDLHADIFNARWFKPETS